MAVAVLLAPTFWPNTHCLNRIFAWWQRDLMLACFESSFYTAHPF
jgi:hypothetical protein